jgi:hypothetical protein
MPPNAPEDVSDERLAQLIDDLEYRLVAGNWDDLETSLRELQRHRAENRWVPWKPGDALPPYGRYACTFLHDPKEYDEEEPWVLWADSLNEGKSTDGWWWPREQASAKLIAYWSQPLPPPYVANASEEGR